MRGDLGEAGDGVPTLVYVSTEQVLLGGRPIVGADETWPYPARPLGHYGRTKALGERIVLGEDGSRLRTISVRPRFVWGVGDATILPALVAAAEAGRLPLVGGGPYLISTTHVGNAVEGILAAAEHGVGGQAYFVTDGEPIEFRTLVGGLLATQGVPPPTRSLPRPVAAAALLETVWRYLPLPGSPPLDRAMLAVALSPCTVSDARARRELGYEGRITRRQGLAALRAAHDG